MKFLTENADKTNQTVKLLSIDEKVDEPLNFHYNILNPSNKIQCDLCKKDITKSTKVLSEDGDFCIGCLSILEDIPEEYYVINKLDFPLFDHEWTADQELMLFEGLQKHGFGNWGEIADFINTNKTRQDVEEHYQNFYIQSINFVPNAPILSKRDKEGRLIKLGEKSNSSKRVKKTIPKVITNQNHQFQRGSLTVHHQPNLSLKNGANPAEIIGYMPKRGDFEVEYDNDAELLLAEMEFNDDDSEQEKKMKFRLIDIYNHKLSERIRRKEFVITRKLLDLKEQMRLDKTRTKEEKQIYNLMKVFARFSTANQHEKLVQGILREKQIRQRIQELKQFKKKGFRTLAEIQDELDNKKRKEEHLKKKQIQFISVNDQNKTRRMRKQLTVEKVEKKVVYLSKEEEELCQKFSITHKQYLLVKETIIRESIRQGIIEKDQTSKIFKIEKQITDGIFDFLVEKEDIIARKIES